MIRRFAGEIEIVSLDRLAPGRVGVGEWTSPIDLLVWGLAPGLSFWSDNGIERVRLAASLALDGVPMVRGAPLFVQSRPPLEGNPPAAGWPPALPSPAAMLLAHVIKVPRGGRLSIGIANRGHADVGGPWLLCVVATEPLAAHGFREVIA